MPTRLSHRIDLLERWHSLARGPEVCPECGKGSVDRQFIVEWQGDIEDDPDRCTICDRQIRFRIEFDQRG